MFKKFIGVVAMLAILVLVVMTALGAGTYKSMLTDSLFSGVAEVENEVLQIEVVDVESANEPVQIIE